MTHRTKIETLKTNIRKDIEKDILSYKRAVIREIDSLWRTFKVVSTNDDIETFARYLLDNLNIPKGKVNAIIKELKTVQSNIADVWGDYFSEASGKNIFVDYEKLVALHSVDFKEINKDIRNTVVKEFKESVNKNYNFETIRARLQKSNLSTSSIYNLANTAVSQFDNASMFEYALQAGINEFLYDGILMPDSRLFCIEHFHKTFTYEEILAMDNGQGLPVVTSCGGYNCHHYWTAKI